MTLSDTPHRRKVSITVTLAVSIGLLVAIAVIAELVLGLSAGRRNTLTLLNEKAVFMMDAIETGMRRHLDPAADIVAHVQEMVESGHLEPGDRTRLGDALAGMFAAAPQVTALAYWDSALQQTVAIQPEGKFVRVLQQDRSHLPEFAEILRNVDSAKGPVWRKLAFSDNITLINVVHPVRQDGELIGFAGAAVSMPGLSSMMTRLGDVYEANAFILYGPDHVLAHPHLVSPHPDLSAETPAVPRNRVGDLLLANLQDSEPVEGFKSAAANGVQVESIDLFDTYHVVFSRRIDDYGDVPWIVGAHIPGVTVGVEFGRLQAAALAGAGLLIVSILAAVFLGHRIARPIKRASIGATQISTLDITDAQPLQSSRITELNDQAHAFNAMLEGLKWFQTYVPKTLVRRLIREGGSSRSEERELTIMFTDIVGFTSLSEALPAAEVADILNRHFAILGSCIEQEGGTIDKFIGDSVMAFWGAPEPQGDHAAKAMHTARAIALALEQSNEQRRLTGRQPIRIRIGLHTGPVVVGNIGAPSRINYTIVGDTVNTAQRIEQLAKGFDQGSAATTLISAKTANAAVESDGLQPAGAFEVKGRSEPVEVFKLL